VEKNMELFLLRAWVSLMAVGITCLYFCVSTSKVPRGQKFQRYYRVFYVITVLGFLVFANCHLDLYTGFTAVILPTFLGVIGVSVHNSIEYFH
jgi:hypothetical protein